MLSDVDIALYHLLPYDQYVRQTSVGRVPKRTSIGVGYWPFKVNLKVEHEISLTVFELTFYGNPKKQTKK